MMTEQYEFLFCSEELILSEQIKISQSYPDKKVSEIVQDILENKLKVNKKMNYFSRFLRFFRI